jgi:acyl carrier protein
MMRGLSKRGLTSDDILEGIAAIFHESVSGATGVKIAMDTKLTYDLGLDSLKLVQIMVSIEDKYGIEFDVEDLDPRHIVTISDLVAVTEKTIRQTD